MSIEELTSEKSVEIQDENFEKLRDLNYLPTREDVYNVFEHYDNTDINFGDRKRAWNSFCNAIEPPIFEFFNEGYINALGDYIINRLMKMQDLNNKPFTVLEIGAGDGRLAHFLQKKLNDEMPDKIKVVASDTGSWKIEPTFPVENLSNREALENYKPQIVICSWMPPNVDFSADIRNCDSVKEYLLIGEAAGGCTGDNWLTWGLDLHGDHDENEERPYEKDGFIEKPIDDLSEQQLCKLDIPSADRDGSSVSQTISFRRTK